MIALFISTVKPPNPNTVSEFRIEVGEYAKAMQQNWPDANIYIPDSGQYSLRWELTTKTERGILGGLQTDKMTVSFGISYFDSALQFILWHRKYVPPEVALYLFDENLLLMYQLRFDDRREDLEAEIRNKLG